MGIAVSAVGPISQWAYQCDPNDLTICPPGSDHESAYRGAITLGTISMTPRDLAAHFANEGCLEDEAYWRKITLMPVGQDLARQMRISLSQIMTTIKSPTTESLLRDAGYIRRLLVETFGSALLARTHSGRQPTLASAKFVRAAEDFLAEAGTRPLHVSELCSYLGIPRRSLHRAFAEVLGIGPMTFIRRSRLTAAYSILRNGDPMRVKVSDVASDLGFAELGRFAGYYKAQFGESPSDTLRRAPRGAVFRGARFE